MVNASIITKPRALWHKQRPVLPSLWYRRLSVSQLKSMRHTIDEPIEEELLPGDRLKYFHPTRSGEVLDSRYKTIVKLGYGGGSTVWLAENLRLYTAPCLARLSNPPG